MDSQDIKNTKFWTGAILYNPEKQEVLLQKRDDKAPVNPNLWGLFGGSNEFGETPDETLIRELKEELAITFTPSDFSLYRDYLNPKRQCWRYIYLINTTIKKSEVTLGEGEDLDWIPIDKVLSYALTDKTRYDLEYFLKDKL